MHYPSASLLRLFIYIKWYWNIYQLSITYGFRPRLRSRLTLGGSTFPRKPWTFDRVDYINARATHAGILSCMQSTRPFDRASAQHTLLLYQYIKNYTFLNFGLQF